MAADGLSIVDIMVGLWFGLGWFGYIIVAKPLKKSFFLVFKKVKLAVNFFCGLNWFDSV
jgi:hypothetical protein